MKTQNQNLTQTKTTEDILTETARKIRNALKKTNLSETQQNQIVDLFINSYIYNLSENLNRLDREINQNLTEEPVRKMKTYILFCAQCSHKNLESAILLRPKTITSVCSYCHRETEQRVIGFVSALLPKGNLLLHYTHRALLKKTAQRPKTDAHKMTIYAENSFKFVSVKTVKP
jgi:hypothetical protein